MVYFCAMNGQFKIVILIVFLLSGSLICHAQQTSKENGTKVLPISKEINRAIIETYEYLQTIPTEKGRQKHLKAVEKGLKEQYTPRMKKLSFSQGKLLIKLVDRQTHSTSYELVKAFMGPFKAGFYQTFAALFGASLKKQYDPTGDDALTERVILMVESGQL